jgi:hypothetical protein
MRALRFERGSSRMREGSRDGALDSRTGLPSAMLRRGCDRPPLKNEVARVRSARGPYPRTYAKKAAHPLPVPRAGQFVPSLHSEPLASKRRAP